MKALLIALLLVPQFAAAGVYMCVDPATGKTSFTDKACASNSAREEVRVEVANPGNNSRGSGGGSQKAWVSQRDTTRSGLEYNNKRRSQYGNEERAIAAADS